MRTQYATGDKILPEGITASRLGAAWRQDIADTDRERAFRALDPQMRTFFQNLINRLHGAGTGSASRPMRLGVLHQLPSIDRGEITDKGSINQRAVLEARSDMVAAHYEGHGLQLSVFQPNR